MHFVCQQFSEDKMLVSCDNFFRNDHTCFLRRIFSKITFYLKWRICRMRYQFCTLNNQIIHGRKIHKSKMKNNFLFYVACICEQDLGSQFNHFILADAPTFNTIKDFWCMIWSQESKYVVSLSTAEEVSRFDVSHVAFCLWSTLNSALDIFRRKTNFSPNNWMRTQRSANTR